MVAHSAENSYSVKTGANAPHGWRIGTKPRVLSSIAAQWLIPTISALSLLSANVQQFHPLRSDTDTCLPHTAIVPMSIETTEPCSDQEDNSNYIMAIMNNHNYSFAHNQAAINKHKQEAINNTDAISNKTSLIVDKIYNIVLASLTSLNQPEERTHNDFSSFSTVSMLRNHRSVSENNSMFPQFSDMQDEPEDKNYYNREDDPSYYSTANEDHGNKDKIAPEYPNYEISDADVSIAPTETLYHDLNIDEVVRDKPNTNSMPPTHNQHDQQFEEDTQTSDVTETPDTVISSSPSLPPQQTGSNFSTVKFSTSPTITSQSLLVANDDTFASSIMEENIISVTAGIESSNSLSLPNVLTEAISQTSAGGEELTTISYEFGFQQVTDTSAESNTEPHISVTIKSSTESQIITQTVGLTNVQIPDAVNLCVVKCYFSGSFLKSYLFILLFLCYFLPVLASLVIYFATDKNLTMMQSLEVKRIEEPTTTAEEKDATETACTMHLTRMISAANTVKHLITTSTLLWTPIFVETLLRVWFCFNTPRWLTTLLFVLGQTNTIIRNALNLQLVRSHACSGTVQPLEVEQGKDNSGISTKLFTKAKAVVL